MRVSVVQIPIFLKRSQVDLRADLVPELQQQTGKLLTENISNIIFCIIGFLLGATM